MSSYLLGRSVHIRGNKLLFIGGLTGTHNVSEDDDLLTTCSMVTLRWLYTITAWTGLDWIPSKIESSVL